jgi:hypothetical protein
MPGRCPSDCWNFFARLLRALRSAAPLPEGLVDECRRWVKAAPEAGVGLLQSRVEAGPNLEHLPLLSEAMAARSS